MWNAIFPKSKRIGLISILGAALCTTVTAFIRMQYLSRKTPIYEELVAGYTSWYAYFKEADMTIAYHVLFGVVGFYLLFSFLLNLLSKKVAFLEKEAEEKCISPKVRTGLSNLTEIFYLIMFTQFSLGILGKGISILLPGLYGVIEKGFQPAQILLVAGVYIFWVRDKKKEKSDGIEKLLFWSQMLLPLVFLVMTYHEYNYQGNIVSQYQSGKLIVLGVIISFLMIGYIFYKRKKEPEVKIYITTFLALAAFASYQLPKGTISETPLDFFHNGELSVPLHQLLEFGTIPYLDTTPIHGICDYFQSGICYLLFDGIYATFEAAGAIGCVLIGVLTAALFYYFVENKVLALLCILLFSLFGDPYYYVRWAFVLPSLILVFSKPAREDFSKMLWYWVFLSILSIAWNPSIGGACALAIFPVILWECFHEKGYLQLLALWKERKERKGWFAAYIFLFILGVCFIPMFLAILRYITQNTSSMLETIGDVLTVELTSPYVWYAIFGFVLPLLTSFYFFIGKKGSQKKLIGYAICFLLIFNAIIVEYTFVRAQSGDRGILTITACCLFMILMVLLPSIKESGSREALMLILLLLGATTATKGANLITMPQKLLERGEISEEFHYAKGEELGLPGLGNIYITEDLEKELVDLNHIANELCGDTYQFVDMTNQLAHYNILNKEVLLPFSSTYNTNNELTQTKAIEVLNELQPEVIVVAPEWKHEAGTLSLRNYHMYQWILENDYVPCKYESILFFTNKEEIQSKYEAAYEEMAQCMHLENLRRLPIVWASEPIEETYTEDVDVTAGLVDTNSKELSENTYLIEGMDAYYLYVLDQPVSGEAVDFLRIRANIEGVSKENSYDGVIYFMEEGESLLEEKKFIFDGEAGEFLIPLSSSPYWTDAEKNVSFMIKINGEFLSGKEIELELELEKYIGIGRNSSKEESLQN